MAEAGELNRLTHEQASASDPAAHRWVRASAGTGKTAVLSARVLRLLLSGVAPEHILCLTFTKAGAAEMAERVHSRLARWVQGRSVDVARDLVALGEDPGPEAIARARLLFARVLDATGGGLRIQTIHSFCQALLAAFPLEAGLVPGFRPLDERGQGELARRALIAMIEEAGQAQDDPVLAALEMLALRLGEEGTQAYLARCVPAAQLLEMLPEDLAGFLLAFLDLPDGDIDAHLADRCAEGVFPVAALQAVARANGAWGAKSGLACADIIAAWLSGSEAQRPEGLADLLGVLLTKDGEVKNRANKNLLEAEPDYVDLASACGAAIKALLDLRKQAAFARTAAQGLTAGRAYARAYAKAKRQAGAVDFDDLIGRASALLTQPGMADWIRYKLDQQVDHILVDEAQDTNDAQWDIVWSIVEEFLEVEPDEQARLRTLFVVGDTKQAIFGFQGTSPEAFSSALQRFREATERVGHPFAELPLARSFRSMPAVLDVVDAVLDAVGHDRLGLETSSAPHQAARQHPGEVLLLPPTSLLPSESDEEGEADETAGEGEEDWLADHQRRHAEKIARLVKGMIGTPLATQGRPARAGDVLILLRSRSALSRLIVARLYEAGVPVAGVDRLRLQAPLAVRDLLAALRFAVQPEDDLNLANLLVSPLIGWTQDELLARAVPREGSLWRHLRATLAPELQAPLRTLLGQADFTTPYRYLEAILSGAMDGRRKLIARLGEEARDAIDELLNAALGFEADDHPSLQRFIDWFDRGDADIKRELGEGGDMVRVMTVHGAKGLEAPVVILADAAFDPGQRPRADAVSLPVTEAARLPLIRPAKGEAAPAIEQAMQSAERLDMEEHWRLLYVGLTRAEERLIVTGSLGSRARGEPPKESWYQAVDLAMRTLGAADAEVPDWGKALRWSGPAGLAPAKPKKVRESDASSAEPALPAWLRAPAPQEARPPRPLSPSALVEDDVPNPPPDGAMRAAAERGRQLHALFERLPDLPAAERSAAASRWLERAGVADAGMRTDLLAHVSAVLDDPDHAALFGPDALAEAPIAAVVAGQVIAGTVDRLLVTDDLVHIVDFKTGRHVPDNAVDLPVTHVRQMAAYAAALAEIFSGRPQRVSLLYTAAPRLIDLPPALLAAHKPGLLAQEHKLGSTDLEADASAT
ncbi:MULTISPECIES: double-strand break repair helicase AddA [unclassified Sphingobium]|uniref:double-strand break repair helicase AddA n=1 Tax=unclassified Sphingobium TaxID=2611147 RepID=UPI0022242AD0|nr:MULTISPECIES: double-strand break repair helicase AddA [unclassified Sphingobium]MCW2381651.1 ATP-dependent helicase/nuclease subunit A [Sphingobium sp. B2D3B]MCW2398242.1 ATP-dependent helicase/nuclease subunit A [Sphingobium sp. B2D3C]